VTFGVGGTDSDTIKVFLKELKVKLTRDPTTGVPVVKDFKIDITGVTEAADVNEGIISFVKIVVPKTVVTALGGTEYEEEIKDEPNLAGGHTEAEYERQIGATPGGVDISRLMDGVNNQLKERKGACSVAPVAQGN